MDSSPHNPVLLPSLPLRLLSLLHTVVIFTVTSLYTNKAVSFSSTVFAIPKVFKRLLITYLWVTLLMFIYNFVFVIFLVLLIIAIDILLFLCCFLLLLWVCWSL
ncbi:hypothetical protein AHAS_Ahas13G0402100 [Arachis hypogaea]